MKLLGLEAKNDGIPVSATFELTPHCNFSCPMCYVHLTESESKKIGGLLPASRWIDFAEQLRELGTVKLTLTGGEPLTRPDFKEIYKELNQMGFMLIIMSNGYLIDEHLIDFFEKYGKPHYIRLTQYGASDKTYEAACGVKNGYGKFINAVNLLKKADIAFGVSATITKANECDFEEMYRSAKEYGYPFKHTIAVSATARGTSTLPDKVKCRLSDFREELTLENLEKLKAPVSLLPYDICGQYKCSAWISWYGRLLACSFTSEPSADILGQPIKSALAELIKKQNEFRYPRECEKCSYAEFCKKCPGLFTAAVESSGGSYKELCDEAEKLYKLYDTLKKGDADNEECLH